jgi:hypothetical protein
MKINRVIMVLILAFPIFGVGRPIPAQELHSLDQTAVLYPAPRKHDSYSLYYNIIVKSPGLIRIRLDLDSVTPELVSEMKFLSVSLRQMDSEVEVRRVEAGSDGIDLEYGVDAYELNRTDGEYRIVISNWSEQHTAVARIVAWYPGDDEAEKAGPDIPAHPRIEDLTF